MKLPEYVLMREVTIRTGRYGGKVLPVGSFVRPIEIKWVPKDVIEEQRIYNFDKESYYYTYYGIVIVPNEDVRMI